MKQAQKITIPEYNKKTFGETCPICNSNCPLYLKCTLGFVRPIPDTCPGLGEYFLVSREMLDELADEMEAILSGRFTGNIDPIKVLRERINELTGGAK
jgi:hypothetical protein